MLMFMGTYDDNDSPTRFASLGRMSDIVDAELVGGTDTDMCVEYCDIY